ncbi:C40 family peptidase [Streptomyces sp. CMB-StM0423]|uniref:C40 family peptidase n=1 Tax=Streptomyces sp. CMB-StM0423 TaxID=2059884 RepID=UPI000C70DFDB|nr:C40 family peptidase [Streptomyces sp. CMB-StM0423]AUH40660.1 NlpC/P60 family protein [Streptomyces sp. CMB-StM0423]
MSRTRRPALTAASAVLLATVLALPADAAPVPDVPEAADAADAADPADPADPAADAAPDPAAPAADGAAPAADAPLGELLTRLQTLHGQAERATEAYHATAEDLTDARAETARLTGDLADTRADLATARRRAGLLARAQYRGPGLAPYLQLLVARDTETALDRKQVISRAIGNQAAVVTRLESGAKRLGALTDSSREALDRQRELAGERKRRRDRVDDRLTEVADALAELTPAKLAALDQLEVRGAEEDRRELMAPDGEDGGGPDAVTDGKPGGARPGAAGGTDRADKPGAWSTAEREPSRAGRRAVSYALDQVGKPYRAGTGGPRAYDSSGLTQRAWREAGVRIPRTARGQWRELRRVPLTAMRPGDIVVYHRDASHVALYLGHGRVVEAPRTGQRVRVVPVTIRPLRGAVRPG